MWEYLIHPKTVMTGTQIELSFSYIAPDHLSYGEIQTYAGCRMLLSVGKDTKYLTPSLPDLSWISLSKTFLSNHAVNNAKFLQARQIPLHEYAF